MIVAILATGNTRQALVPAGFVATEARGMGELTTTGWPRPAAAMTVTVDPRIAATITLHKVALAASSTRFEPGATALVNVSTIDRLSGMRIVTILDARRER